MGIFKLRIEFFPFLSQKIFIKKFKKKFPLKYYFLPIPKFPLIFLNFSIENIPLRIKIKIFKDLNKLFIFIKIIFFLQINRKYFFKLIN
jgi:hypothetical protein